MSEGRGRGNFSGRGCVPSGQRKYEIQNLWDRHHVMKRLAVLGHSNKEIAEACGVTPVTVCTVLNSAIMRKEVANLRAAVDLDTVDVAKKIKEIAVKSVSLLEHIIEDENTPMHLRAKVAMDNLSRAGYAPQIKVHNVNEFVFGPEDIRRLKEEATRDSSRFGLTDESAIEAEYLQV